jgi:hypothetical protein
MLHDTNGVQAIVGDANNLTFEELSSLDMGEQCPHTTDIWFQDPRPNPPPLRSRSSIWREIVRDSDRPRSKQNILISSFLSGDDANLLAEEAYTEEQFSEIARRRFPELPLELKDAIFEKARRPRLVDLFRLEDSCYVHRLPPPFGAEVDSHNRERALKEVVPSSELQSVMRTGEFHHFTPSDVVLIQNFWLGFESRWCKPGNVFHKLQSETVVINQHLMLPQTAKSIRRAEDVVTALDSGNPSEEMLSAFRGDISYLLLLNQAYQFLRNLEHLKTLAVSWVVTDRRQGGFQIHIDAGNEADEERVQKRVDKRVPSVQTLVDLYDDARLAEVMSLQSSHLSPNKLPPYSHRMYHPHSGTHCLNCERIQWETSYKARIEKLWVLLHAEEVLDLDMLDLEVQPAWRDLFYPLHKPLPKGNPWVDGILAKMPELRPMVLFQFNVKSTMKMRFQNFLGGWHVE